eukprot:6038572-Amphidinium_carterae.1
MNLHISHNNLSKTAPTPLNKTTQAKREVMQQMDDNRRGCTVGGSFKRSPSCSRVRRSTHCLRLPESTRLTSNSAEDPPLALLVSSSSARTVLNCAL